VLGVVSITDATPTPDKEETGADKEKLVPAMEAGEVPDEKGEACDIEGHDTGDGRGTGEDCGTIANTETAPQVEVSYSISNHFSRIK